MLLRSKLTDGEVLIYREKCGVLAFAAVMGLACLAFAAAFYWATSASKGATGIVPAAFGGVFALAGAAILLRLPGQARRVFHGDGATVVAASATELGIVPYLDAKPKRLPWSEVAEVVLAERLRVVERDEVASSTRALVALLTPAAGASASWADRAMSGVAKSGAGRPYLLGHYPRGEGRAVEAALRRVAPRSLRVRRHERVVFDLKAAADTYDGRLG